MTHRVLTTVHRHDGSTSTHASNPLSYETAEAWAAKKTDGVTTSVITEAEWGRMCAESQTETAS